MREKRTYDVFISHSLADAPLAAEIAAVCRSQGVIAFTDAELHATKSFADELWEALAESRALLVILSADGPTPNMSLELGAARAWNKPVFGLLPDPAFNGSPPGFSDIRLYTIGRLSEVIRAIKVGAEELSDEDRLVLATLYRELGVPVDQFALEPSNLAELVKRFSSGTGKLIPGERLLSELLRLRKQGRLSRLRGTEKAGHKHGTA
jgi:hypothetical protein